MTHYPGYKQTEFAWIGQIPAHWATKPVWMMFRLGRGRVISNEEIGDKPGPYPVYSSQTENDGIMGYLNTYDFDGDYITWTTDGAKAGTVFYRTGKFNCTNVCGTLSPSNQDVDLKFFGHALNIVTSRFVRQDINPKLMNNVMAKIRVQVPSLAEQTQIANFLDHKTAQIDELIRAKERKIELLGEYRASLIQQAVTKGLDPNVEMKSSKVEFIVAIPRKWNTVRCAQVFEVKNVKKTSGEINLSVYRDYGVIRRDSRDDNQNIVSDDTSSYKLVEPGDFVFNKMKCWQGSLGVSEYRGIVSPSYTVCKPKRHFHGKYFHYLLRSHSYTQEFKRLSYGVRPGQWELRFKDFKDVLIPYPSLWEQIQIADFLDHKTKQIDELKSNEEGTIKLLKEYRQSFISQAVTGKIDVRSEV